MTRQTLESRVESLERRVTTIEQLPERMNRLESQILQLRQEMRDEFSAVRVEMAAGDEETRRSLREEIRAGDEETRRTLREEIRAGNEETRLVLREEIRTGDEETRRFSRILHEDAVGRISIIGEGLAANTEAIQALDEKVDTIHTGLSRAIDESRAETRAMFEQVFSRLDTSTPMRHRPRRSKKP